MSQETAEELKRARRDRKEEKTLDLHNVRQHLHQIPEQGFKEVKTQQFLLNYIDTIKDDRVI